MRRSEVLFTVAMAVIAVVVLILRPTPVGYYFDAGVIVVTVIVDVIGRRLPKDHAARQTTLHELLLRALRRKKSSQSGNAS